MSAAASNDLGFPSKSTAVISAPGTSERNLPTSVLSSKWPHPVWHAQWKNYGGSETQERKKDYISGFGADQLISVLPYPHVLPSTNNGVASLMGSVEIEFISNIRRYFSTLNFIPSLES
ncbi:hypothetical protein QN277_026772 [Acacia crassicarpa]|uniref:Uncharacterized protein n=1 Tax=Acacia crassicarpa TaxID=499986 RepID=A0AAE1K4Y2_9FABA|nr:hypothetical protein QN277_026772 [Acacia crassicarpa]